MSKKKKYKFSMPLYLTLSDKSYRKNKTTGERVLVDKPKQYRLNLNEYNQWYHHTKNALKQKYKEIAVAFLKGIKMTPPIRITFIPFYARNSTKRDRANFCCVHEKFFCDALGVDNGGAGCIPDDNDQYILETRYVTGGIDPKNPRMEIIIEEIGEDG